MSSLDWCVLCGSLLFVAAYGSFKTRRNSDLDMYFRNSGNTPWLVVGLSVMATQASAITFLSTPGQGYSDGLGFVQFYFGLPLALIVVAAVAVPMYQRLKVITAYQYLQTRFDLRVRQFTAFLFLIQRGLATGLTIYAPSIILSSLLEWDLDAAVLVIGSTVIFYTVIGGSRAVNVTQMLQISIIFGGMVFAFGYLVALISPHASFAEALQIAAVFERTKTINTSFDPTTRYTVWSGLTGGFFLALAYFGTDQSQVQRYVSGKSVGETRLGLMFNAVLKIPMQFGILLTGVMVFVFYQFEPAPVFFNASELRAVRQSPLNTELLALTEAHAVTIEQKRNSAANYVAELRRGTQSSIDLATQALRATNQQEHEVRQEVKTLLKKFSPGAEARDTDYVFLTFILGNLPQGFIGLLLAAIICAAMSSSAGELSALASTSVVDFYRVSFAPNASDGQLVRVSRVVTLCWGIVAIGFAMVASLFENLIQAVNIVGSLFYGTILGVFVVAFATVRPQSRHVLLAGVVSQSTVLLLYTTTNIGFLWFNFIGCAVTVTIAVVGEFVERTRLPQGSRPCG